MSQTLKAKESQWLAQFTSMREAIAQLKLDGPPSMAQRYGHDIAVDDADLSSGSSDDIWNVFSEEDEEEAEDDQSVFSDTDITPSWNNHEGSGSRIEWLRKKCSSVSANHGDLGLDAGRLEDQLLAFLASDMQSKDAIYFEARRE